MADDYFEFIDHTADWAMRILGRDLNHLLINAARGMNQLVAPQEKIPGDQEREVELFAIDREGLLVEWLSELVFIAETEGILFHNFELYQTTSTWLKGKLSGGRTADIQREIKAVTYHDLSILETDDGLEAVVVFDV